MSENSGILDFGFYNLDCMEGMKCFPDQYFDLAIVDPPYGINVGKTAMGAGGVLPHTGIAVQQICAPGGGNKMYIPFGGKKKKTDPAWGGVPDNWRDETLRKSEWGGVSQSLPKFTRRSTTATHRTPDTSVN